MKLCQKSKKFASSTDNLVRAPFLIHYALNNDERATLSRFPFTNVMWRVRGRLTLMLAVAANAAPTPAPARLHWFTNVTLGVPFATSRTRRASQVVERFSCLPTVAGWRMILGAMSGGERVSGLLTRHFVPRGVERAMRLRSPFLFSA